AGDELSERRRDRDERPRQWEPGDQTEWRPRDRDRDFERPDASPRRNRDRAFDDSDRLNSPPHDGPPRREAAAERRPPTREERSYGDQRPVGREPVHNAEQSEQSRLAEQQELSRPAEQQEQMRRWRDQRARAERLQRERELFGRAAAGAAAVQGRQDSIDQAVAEIAARQKALDHERAVESARESARSWGIGAQAAAAPVLSETPPHVPQQPEPGIRRPAAPEPERVFAPWPDGWRSRGPAPEPPRGASETSRPPQTSRAAPEPSIDISGLQEQLREMTARIE